MPSAWRVGEASSSSAPAVLVAPITSMASSTTMVAWPRANQKPTDLGLAPSAVSLRVTLSIAAM
jgi:hypothetical protein